MPWRFALFSAFLALLNPPAALASCGSESCPLDHSSRWGETRLTFDFSYQYIDQDQPRVGREDSSVGAIPGHHDEVRTVNRIATLRAAYRATPAWSFAASLPYVDRFHAHIHNHMGAATPQRWSYDGIGDLELVGVRSFQGGSRSTFFASAGVKAPTGVTEVEEVDGDQPEPSARPSTGSWDLLAGLGAEWRFSGPGSGDDAASIPIRLSLTGRRNGRGTDDYRVGSEVQAHAAGEYSLSSSIALIEQINLRLRAKDTVGATDVDEENTGGSWLYVSPGVRYSPTPRTSFYGLVQVPVYQRVNGIQVVSDVNFYFGVTGGIF